ncbi:hypothetical protein AVEN_19674-1 [Araneus ventricosus]|uniref:Uncharacterized protein n=1 Tax=Araneus ventricosus TaxID=182803 RepID=A0A4Y2C2R6_ARAVE|nr:hypothetical protein AVEN_19674-1 [Araneus ventricosus]
MLQHLRQKTKQLVQQIEERNTKDHLAKVTGELQKETSRAEKGDEEGKEEFFPEYLHQSFTLIWLALQRGSQE